MAMEHSYDFIVIGAGPSGSALSSRLSATSSHPTVLLLEAGGTNASLSSLSPSERFTLAFAPNSPLNWGYQTTPQTQLAGQKIDYSRGKGLGGSTAINFCGWTVGSRDDYDEWARLVGDESFAWSNVRRVLDRVESLHSEIPVPGMGKYVCSSTYNRNRVGPVHLSYGQPCSWDPELENIFIAATQAGLSTNADVNSGSPLGMGMGTVCIHDGQRITSSTAYLSNPPSNLTILTNSGVAKILFSGTRATGVRTIDGREFFAKEEVIASGGAINTPQILMLSGIGSREELEKHGVDVMCELTGVGRNLQDHCFSSVGIVMRKDHSLLEVQQSPTPMGWFKVPEILESTEFEGLDEKTRVFLRREQVPCIEIATHTPPVLAGYEPEPDTTFLGAMCLIMNPQSRGTITLRSSLPTTPPIISPSFLTHAYDKRTIISGIRQTISLLSAPIYATQTLGTIGPGKDSDDDAIWEHVKKTTASSWHMSCTVKMGRAGERDACVDSNFRVLGTKALRVVDLSVCPFVMNNHTQSTAYVVGEIAAEKIIKEYKLDESGTKHKGSSNL